MLPIERRKRIKELIQDKQNMKISELSQLLGVSEMTVHRDLKPLIDEGFVIKTFGGITLALEKEEPAHNTNECVICNRDINERMAYRMILQNNKIEMACCAHCGLMRHRQLGDQIMQAICHDFLRQTTISATSAWYVMDTSIILDCCQPQVLTFELKEHAEKFVKGFGGKIYPFDEAGDALMHKMNGCHHKH